MSSEQLAAGVAQSDEASKIEVRTTADGSPTLYVPALNEHYHSHHGAAQESRHVFIAAGLQPLLATSPEQQRPIRLLEVGLGTGLNALLTLGAAQAAGAAVTYDGYETVPLPPATVAALAPQWAGEPTLGQAFGHLHTAPWNEEFTLAPGFTLTKIQAQLQAAALPTGYYNLIYFDAFAPEKQPELWTEDVFAKLYAAAAPGAVLVSYCAQGQFRRNLRAAKLTLGAVAHQHRAGRGAGELLRPGSVSAQPAGGGLAYREAARPARQARNDAGAESQLR